MSQSLVSRKHPSLISLSLLLVGLIIVLPTKRALAEDGKHIEGTLTAAFSVMPNTASDSFCGGAPLATVVEAHGIGSSTLGALSVSIQKTISAPAMHGCLTLTAPNGDTLNAIYDGTEAAPNANNFRDASGTLTFTGGTGRFEGAGGTADFTAVFSRIGGTTNPIQGMAFYSVNGTIFLQHDDR